MRSAAIFASLDHHAPRSLSLVKTATAASTPFAAFAAISGSVALPWQRRSSWIMEWITPHGANDKHGAKIHQLVALIGCVESANGAANTSCCTSVDGVVETEDLW